MEEAAAIPLAGTDGVSRALHARRVAARARPCSSPASAAACKRSCCSSPSTPARASIVTSSSEEKLERARALGADLAINYAATPDWPKLLRATGPVDLVVDSSGGETLRKALDAVRPAGASSIYGGTNGDATIKMFPLFWKHVTILGNVDGQPAGLCRDARALRRGPAAGDRPRLCARRQRCRRSSDLAAADQFGKIVLPSIKPRLALGFAVAGSVGRRLVAIDRPGVRDRHSVVRPEDDGHLARPASAFVRTR